MTLHTLNSPSHLFTKPSKNRILHKTRINPVQAVNKPTSTKTFSLNSASNGSLLSQKNTVGIIGGVSIDVTLEFVKKLVNWSNEGKQDESVLPFVLCSDPILRNSDHGQIVEKLRQKRIFLERSGARCIVMPCHALHSWYDEFSKGCYVPVLHMGDCLAKELKEAKLKPLEAGCPLRIGVLGTNEILKMGFYQDKLQKEGFEVILPDKDTMEHTIIPSTEAISRKDIEGARNLLRVALQVFLMRAVNTIIIASDDMRALLPHDDPLLRKCIDPLDSLARSTIKLAQVTIKAS